MCNGKLLSRLLVLFLSTQTAYTKKDDKKLLRIVGGQSTSNRKYPYVGRLEIFISLAPLSPLKRRLHMCTCSVLTPTWTLSASHCYMNLDKLPNTTFVVRYGSTLPLNGKQNYSKVLKFILHPSFKSFTSLKKTFMENDIALLKTDPIILPKYGRVSSVDYMSLVGFTAVVAGFGITNYTKLNEMFFADTLVLNMPLQTLNVVIKRCASDALDYLNLYPGLCLARICGEAVSACQGDSGGPLIHNSRIVGVSSLGSAFDCSDKVGDRYKSNFVDIITAASPFTEWIGDVIKDNAVATSQFDGEKG